MRPSTFVVVTGDMRAMKCYSALTIGLVLLVPTASYAASIGSLTFEDTAFVDGITTATGTPRTYDVNQPDGGFDSLSVVEATSGTDISTGIFCSADCSFDVLFLDNHIVNGTGDDLAVFEGGRNDPLSITINGVTQVLSVFDFAADNLVDATNFPVGYWLLDLTDFGVTDKARISSFRLDLLFDETRGGEFASADFVVAGALNSAAVPLPAAGWLLLAGLGGLGLLRARKTS